jgi:hypothetical protein
MPAVMADAHDSHDIDVDTKHDSIRERFHIRHSFMPTDQPEEIGIRQNALYNGLELICEIGSEAGTLVFVPLDDSEEFLAGSDVEADTHRIASRALAITSS